MERGVGRHASMFGVDEGVVISWMNAQVTGMVQEGYGARIRQGRAALCIWA